MATGSVARIGTNAMRGRYDDNGDNLKLSFADATEMPRNIIAHELHGLTRRLCDTRMATGSVALIYTNAMRGYMTTTGTTWDNLKLSFAGAISNE